MKLAKRRGGSVTKLVALWEKYHSTIKAMKRHKRECDGPESDENEENKSDEDDEDEEDEENFVEVEDYR